MQYHQFAIIPKELKLEIIRKCYPIPYIRLRQSCHFVDEVCEDNRKRLGIYCYRKDPKLYLCNRKTIRNENYAPCYYLITNYRKKNASGNSSFILTTTNITNIKRSLSGFTFTHVGANSDTFGGANKEYQETLELFVEFAHEVHAKYLFLCNATVELTKRLLDVRSIKHMEVCATEPDILRILEHDSAKNVPSIDCIYLGNVQEMNVDNIVQMSLGRKCLQIRHDQLKCSTVWRAMNHIFERWEKVTGAPDTLTFEFPIRYENIYEQGRIHLPESSLHLGRFSFNYHKECDIWIIENENKHHWRILSILRDPVYGEGFEVQTAHSQDELAMMLIDFTGDYRFYEKIKAPIDYSIFHTCLTQAATLEEVRKEFLNLVNYITYQASEVQKKYGKNFLQYYLSQGPHSNSFSTVEFYKGVTDKEKALVHGLVSKTQESIEMERRPQWILALDDGSDGECAAMYDKCRAAYQSKKAIWQSSMTLETFEQLEARNREMEEALVGKNEQIEDLCQKVDDLEQSASSLKETLNFVVKKAEVVADYARDLERKYNEKEGELNRLSDWLDDFGCKLDGEKFWA